MTKISRDIFCRGVRMQHKFYDLADTNRNDPLGSTSTFDMPWPKRVDDLSKQAAGRPCEVSTDGQYGYRTEASPVCKPSGGYATIDGPKPDLAQAVGMPIPVGTKRRLGPPRTDK